MKKFLQNFKDEASKLLNITEIELLALENDLTNDEIISSIYRTLHTLKGVAGMFNFNDVAKLAHQTENIFDAVKDNLIIIDKQIIDIVYDFVDYVRENFSDKQNNKFLKIQKNKLTENISKITEKLPETDDFNSDEIFTKTYYLFFQPNIDFEERGINLETVFSVIESKGETVKFEKPTQGEDIITKFYLFWEYFIATDVPENNIAEEFLFDDNEIVIVKLSDVNILKNEKFKEKTEELKISTDKIEIDKLSEFIAKIEIPKPQKKEKKINKIIPKNEIKTDRKNKPVKDFAQYEISRISVNAKHLDELMNFVSELITTKEAINIITENTKNYKLELIAEKLEKISRNIQNNALKMRLIPLESIILKFKRLVRDLSKEQNKEIIFETDGTDTELDKTIIDKLVDPLVHIFRNSIDHGIEMPEEREKSGKSRKGKIKLYASYESGNVIIQIHDDGKGIDPEIIRKKAVKKGLIEPGKELDRNEVLDLVFLPGFSTADKVTSVSGRGIGMDIIRKKLLDIRGEVNINSEINLGTYVTIKLPLTLSIVDTLQIMVNRNNYLIPKHLIAEVSEINKKDLDKKNAFMSNNKIIPVVKLIDKFGKKLKTKNVYKVVYVLNKEKKYVFIIDKIVGDHQAVLKPLGEMFHSNQIFSGASILGTGELALMIDINKLIKKLNIEY